jgi:small subunit ribosomal protein S2
LNGIALKDLLEAGVHFGHQTKRWNPKMKSYIFGERNGIYIIDLAKTAKLFRDAEQFTMNLAAEGRTILFVGTKRQAQDAVAEEAQRCGMFFVNQRWLGGLLTNFTTIQRSLSRLRDLEAMETDGRYDSLSKKEIAQIEKEKRKLQKNLEGIRHMSRLPDALFVVDTRKEKIAVDEARKLKIPVIGVVDTNCDPDEVDYVIPGNDDALRAIRLFATKIADSVAEGSQLADKAILDRAAEGAAAEAAEAAEAGETARAAAVGSDYGDEGEDVSMEEVLGAGVRKSPVAAKDEEPQVESQSR